MDIIASGRFGFRSTTARRPCNSAAAADSVNDLKVWFRMDEMGMYALGMAGETPSSVQQIAFLPADP
jgi:hypothetical protein